MQGTKLPDLPPSDAESLEKNVWDQYYEVKAGDFWKGAEINRSEVKDFEVCAHEFVSNEEGVICQKCNFGLIGSNLQVENGQPFFKGQPLFTKA